MADRVRGLRVWHLPVIVWLTVVWLLLWGSITPLLVVGGLLTSALAVAVFPFPKVNLGGTLRPWPAVVLLARFLADLVVASFQVAWLALRPAAPPASAVIRVDLTTDSELRQTLTAELISLVPGSLLIELDSAGRRMWLHVLDGSTPEAVESARRKARTQEHRLLRALGTADEVAASARRMQEDAS